MNKCNRRSNKYCSVPQCSNYCSDTVSLHTFPTDLNVRKKWCVALKIGKPITKTMLVCSDHFRLYDFHPRTPFKTRATLKKNVIPTEKLPKSSIKKKISKPRKTNRTVVNSPYEKERCQITEEKTYLMPTAEICSFDKVDFVSFDKGFEIEEECLAENVILTRDPFFGEHKQLEQYQEEAWKKISVAYNCNIQRSREPDQLRAKYENLKNYARKYAQEKNRKYEEITGGTANFEENPILEKVLDLINTKTVLNENGYDDDDPEVYIKSEEISIKQEPLEIFNDEIDNIDDIIKSSQISVSEDSQNIYNSREISELEPNCSGHFSSLSDQLKKQHLAFTKDKAEVQKEKVRDVQERGRREEEYHIKRMKLIDLEIEQKMLENEKLKLENEKLQLEIDIMKKNN